MGSLEKPFGTPNGRQERVSGITSSSDSHLGIPRSSSGRDHQGRIPSGMRYPTASNGPHEPFNPQKQPESPQTVSAKSPETAQPKLARLESVREPAPITLSATNDPDAESRRRAFAKYMNHAKENSKKGIDFEQERMQHSSRPWGYYNSSVLVGVGSEHPMEQTFNRAIPKTTFRDLIFGANERKGKLYTLDVMGQGGFSDVLPVARDVGITLVDFRTDAQKVLDADQKNKHIIQGNVLFGGVWREAAKQLESQKRGSQKGYDFITCRPEGGWRYVIPEHVSGTLKTMRDGDSELQLLLGFSRRMMRFQSPDKGQLFVDLPMYTFDREKFQDRLLAGQSGYEGNVTNGILHVVRHH